MTNSLSTTLRDALLIVLAAGLLGFAFNRVSPLGIRAPIAMPGKTTVPQPPPANGIQNTTISVQIETAAPPLLAPRTVTWPEAKAMLQEQGAVLIDARTPFDYQAGHIPGAISLPLANLENHIDSFKAQYPPDTKIIAYCTSTQCSISRVLARQLVQHHGYTDVRDMPGGYAEYRIAEYANSTGK